jgi:hypothetical protein
VEDVRRVYILETAQDLVDKGLEMRVGEGLTGSDDGCQIALHEFYYDISRVLRYGAIESSSYPRRGSTRCSCLGGGCPYRRDMLSGAQRVSSRFERERERERIRVLRWVVIRYGAL